MYDLELKHNSSLQVLYLNPLGNFDFSLAIPGYDHSNFVKFKLQNEADYELCSDLCQSNYLESLTLNRQQTSASMASNKKQAANADNAANAADAANAAVRAKRSQWCQRYQCCH